MVRKTIAMDEELSKSINVLARKEQRDFSGAMRYALRIGLLAIANPELTVNEIKDILEAQVEYETGDVTEFDINSM